MKVVSIITNNPIFIELQQLSLKKYLCDIEYEYIVFNDGKYWPDPTNFFKPEENGRQAIEKKCKEMNIKYFNLPNEHHKNNNNPSERHSDSLRSLREYMMGNKDEYLILDGDMFLIDTLNITKYREKICACVLQERQNLKYIWPNYFYIDMNKSNVNLDDFNLHIAGADTGSASSKWLKKYDYVYPNCEDIRYSSNQYENDNFYFIKHLWSGSWNIEELPENLKTNNSLIEFLKNDKRNKDEKYFSEIYDKCMFHYRGSTWLNINDEILHKENINKLKGLI